MSCFFSSANLASFLWRRLSPQRTPQKMSPPHKPVRKRNLHLVTTFCQRLELVVTFCQRLCTGGTGGCSSAGLLFFFFQSFCAFFQRLFSRLSFAMLACWHPGGVLGLGHLLVLPGGHAWCFSPSSEPWFWQPLAWLVFAFFERQWVHQPPTFPSPWQLASWPVWPWR